MVGPKLSLKVVGAKVSLSETLQHLGGLLGWLVVLTRSKERIHLL